MSSTSLPEALQSPNRPRKPVPRTRAAQAGLQPICAAPGAQSNSKDITIMVMTMIHDEI
jgi:hypothetical protein